MNSNNNISISVIRRLCRYYRFLSELISNGFTRISSGELSKKMGLTASQIRQDLNHFGGFGQQGYGYPVDKLKQEIGDILGISSQHNTILIGVGNLGQAVARHMSFEKRGFKLIGMFDCNPNIVGKKIDNLTVQNIDSLDEFCKSNSPAMAILCIPKQVAKDTVKSLYELGIRNYWNFSHYDLSPEYNDIIVENVHMSDSLMTLCYRMNEKEKNR